MKIEKNQSFTPVKLILETQEEVDKVYSIFNFNPLVSILDIHGLWKLFDGLHTDKSNEYHDKLMKMKI